MQCLLPRRWTPCGGTLYERTLIHARLGPRVPFFLLLTSYRTMSKKKREKKWKTKILWAKQTSILAPYPQPLGCFSHMIACRSSSEYTRKMSLISIFNKTSPRTHTELEFDVLDVHKKLVKYVVHLSKRKNWKRNIFLHTRCPNSNRRVFGFNEL
jgi:hypothetical protein